MASFVAGVRSRPSTKESFVEDRNVLYINGGWVAATTDTTIAVENPATEEQLAVIPAGSAEDAAAAVAAARAAFPAWAATSRSERAEYLRRLKDGLAKRAEEIGETIARDVG